MSQLRSLKMILLILSVVGILIELIQLITQRIQYFLKLHSYIKIILFIGVLVFIQIDADACWCAERRVWQMGAVGCVLAWLNLVHILKRLPFTAIPINMMINILYTFFSVIFLPIFLIVTFALPFYMLLANPVSHWILHVIAITCAWGICLVSNFKAQGLQVLSIATY